MPFIQSDFKGNSFSKNGHFETIYPTLFRNIPVPYQRERIILKDGDFIDLDFLKNENSPVYSYWIRSTELGYSLKNIYR